MIRTDWLSKKHRELDNTITILEAQRELIRDNNHKATLQDLKKQRLAIRTELEINLLTANVSK